LWFLCAYKYLFIDKNVSFNTNVRNMNTNIKDKNITLKMYKNALVNKNITPKDIPVNKDI